MAASGRAKAGEGVLSRQLKTGEEMRLAPRSTHALCWAGIREPMIMQTNQALYAQLPHKNPFSAGERRQVGRPDMMRFVGGAVAPDAGLIDLPWPARRTTATGVEYGVQ